MSQIEFKCDPEKVLEVLLWVMNKKKSEGVNLYNIIKIIFEADCYHLNRYGRPVTGVIHKAMEHGTVPDFILNLLKKQPFPVYDSLKPFPFETTGYNCSPTREFNPDFLSETDIEALEVGFKEYGELSFEQVKSKNHAHPAWKEFYKKEEPNKPIPFEALITDDDLREEMSSVPTSLLRL